MGRTNSSSRRKHSKKKSSKVSSEGYRKKKSRRNKSKKLRHLDDSFSSYSDDESTSSSLNSSSSSEGEYTRKRTRSRSRNETKGSKKRNRKQSLSDYSSEDSSPVKKRKRSKKGKKVKKKKKSKKVAYSDSESCSTCKYEDSSDELGSHEGSRGRSREKKKVHRDSTKGRTGNSKNMSKTRRSFSPSSSYELGSHEESRGRSREKKMDHRDSTNGRIGNKNIKSNTSFSPSRSYDSESIEKVTVENINNNNPIRLKSVITVANMQNDEFKEETVYDYDDYPSKSNDSIELADRGNNSPDKDKTKEVNSGFNVDESKISGNIGSEVDDLESILRKKALENLSKFRGGIKTKPVVSVDNKPKIDQSGDTDTQPTRDTVNISHRSRFTWRRDSSVASVKDEKGAASYSEVHCSGSQPVEMKLQSGNLSSTSRLDNKFVNETLKSNVDQKSTADVDQKSTVAVEEGSSKEQKNEGNDNSQFEKKTMSVMRGGEMVQVSYKVYIPNRAPALARRQLKR